MRRSILLILALAAAAISPPAAAAAVLELTDPDALASLAGVWKFRPGDDLGWARPDYDDSAWGEVRIPTGFGRHDAVSELAWYRLEIRLAPQRAPAREERAELRLGILIGKVDSAYELYAGGVKLGSVGELPPAPRMDYDRHGIYPVPAGAVDESGRLVVALRVWKSPATRSDVGGPVEGPFYAGPIEKLTRRELLHGIPRLFLAGLFVVLGLFHLELWRLRPQLASYGWFSVSAVLLAVYTLLRTQWKYFLSDERCAPRPAAVGS